MKAIINLINEMKMQVIKRSFEAENFPVGSEKRKQLNSSETTSEYMLAFKYCVVYKGKVLRMYKTKQEAKSLLITFK